jgi:hypothetical protein
LDGRAKTTQDDNAFAQQCDQKVAIDCPPDERRANAPFGMRSGVLERNAADHANSADIDGAVHDL